MNKAAELRQKSIEARNGLRVAAEEFYNECLLKMEEKANSGFFEYELTFSMIPELLQPFIEDLIMPFFRKGGFEIEKKDTHALFGDSYYWLISWDKEEKVI